MLLVGVVMCTQSGSTTSPLFRCRTMLSTMKDYIVLGFKGGAQFYESGRWVSRLSSEFCTVQVLLGLGVTGGLEYGGFHISGF